MYKRQKYHLRAQCVGVIPNFVNTDLFKPGTAPKEANSVVSVGRLTPVKRFDLLIRACAKIPGVKLTIFGEGPERHKLKELAVEMGIDLDMPGNIPNQFLPEKLASNKVFALVSKWEGHPKALIEAMSCGLPCVCSIEGHGTLTEGVFVAPPEEMALANAIQRFLQDADLLSEYAGRARRFADKRYSFPELFGMEKQILEKISHA